MRFSRLVIEAGQNTVSLSLHHRLTVIAGVDAPVRQVLAQELIGGLGGSRSGVHVEVTEDHGRTAKIIRPTGQADRVIDSATGADLSDEFSTPDGRIDVLATYGISADEAGRLLHIDRQDLDAVPAPDPRITRLAEVNQGQLWSMAARVRVTDDEVRSLQQSAANHAEDAAVVARIEKQHQSLEVVVHQDQRVQHLLVRSSILMLAAAAAVGFIGSSMMLPLLALSGITGLLAFIYRLRVDRAVKSERAALADAGSTSYLGFVARQVDGMMTGTEHRRRLSAAAEDHRNAAIAWTHVAGDIGVDWAMSHHDEISTAARLHAQLSAMEHLSETAPAITGSTLALATALATHLDRLRHLGRGGESFPLILDDPFEDLDPATRVAMLELLERTADVPQIVLMTSDPDVARWARLEALTGQVSLVEPMGGPAEEAAPAPQEAPPASGEHRAQAASPAPRARAVAG